MATTTSGFNGGRVETEVAGLAVLRIDAVSAHVLRRSDVGNACDQDTGLSLLAAGPGLALLVGLPE